MRNPRSAKQIMRDMFRDMPKTQEQKRADRISARDREMPKICELLGTEYKPMRKSA